MVVSKEPQTTSKWSLTLTISVYASTIGLGVSGGYEVSVINSPAVYIQNWCREMFLKRYNVQLSDSGLDLLWASIVSITLLGGMAGSLIGPGISNKFGRRGCCYLCGSLYLIAGIFFYFCRMANSVEMLLIGRLISGIGSGFTIAVWPMYLSEIASIPLRGTVAVFCPVGLTVGVVFGQIFTLHYIFGNADYWHIALSFYVVFVLISCVPIKFYAESPKWLYTIKHKPEKATDELKRLRGEVDSVAIAEELKIMELETNEQQTAMGYCEVLRDKRLRLPLIITCFFLFGQALSGINAIFFYSVSIFIKAGLSQEDAEWASLGAGVLNLCFSLLGPWLMARFDRRPLMLLSTSACGVSLFLLIFTLYFIDDVSWFAIGSIVCILLYLTFFQLGLSAIPFFIGAEIFETAPRSVAMSLGGLSAWFGNFIIGLTFPILQNAWGAFVFAPFVISCVLLFLLTKFYLPETRGRDPSKVAPLLTEGFKSKVR